MTHQSVTSLVDAGVAAGVRVYHAVSWTYLDDLEYKAIWPTPVMSVTP